MKTSNKLYCIQRSSYRFRITKNKQVNTCFFIETDCAHLPLVGKTESTILEQHTYTSFEIEHACSISGTPYIHTYFELVHACSIFRNTLLMSLRSPNGEDRPGRCPSTHMKFVYFDYF